MANVNEIGAVDGGTCGVTINDDDEPIALFVRGHWQPDEDLRGYLLFALGKRFGVDKAVELLPRIMRGGAIIHDWWRFPPNGEGEVEDNLPAELDGAEPVTALFLSGPRAEVVADG